MALFSKFFSLNQKKFPNVCITLFLVVICSLFPVKTSYAQWAVYDGANHFANTTNGIFLGFITGNTTVSAYANASHGLKIFALDGIATMMARLMIQKITAQTVNWINNGFQGNPAFVTNPDQLLLDTADQVFSKQLIKGGPLEKLCGPFRAQVRLAIVKTYLADDDPNRLTCTFGSIGDNIQKIGTDFTNGGGWDAFFKISQESRNNPWGAYTIAQSDIAANIQVAQKNIQKDREIGYGFLSFKQCPKGYTNAEIAAKKPNTNTDPGTINEFGEIDYPRVNNAVNTVKDPKGCSVNPDIVTPGSVISKQLENSLGSPVKQLELTNSINQLVNALMIQLINRIFSSVSGGLRGLAEKQPTDRASLIEQLNTNSPESKQEEQKALANTNKNIPSNLGIQIDPETGETISTNPQSLTPTINKDDIKNEMKQTINDIQNDLTCPTGQTCTITPPPTNNPGGTARGDIATTTDTGGRTGGR
jgi:hypothetical protein